MFSTSVTGRTRGARAFTLIELLIVIMIMLALGGIVLVGFQKIRIDAKLDLQRLQFDSIEDAMDQFHLYLDRYPSEEEGLAVLWSTETLENEDDQTKWRGPYLKDKITADAWGREIVYRNPSEERGEGFFDLVSFGPDGEEGSADDVTNHDRLRDAEGEISDEFDDFSTGTGTGTRAPSGG